MLTDKEIEKEQLWIAKERLKILEKAHPQTQDPNMDCQGGDGQDFTAFHISNDRQNGRCKHER